MTKLSVTDRERRRASRGGAVKRASVSREKSVCFFRQNAFTPTEEPPSWRHARRPPPPAAGPTLPTAFDWKNIHLYRTSQSEWPDGYPTEFRDFFSPEDGPGIHALLVHLIRGATKSVVLNMFGCDDDEIDAEIHKHSHNPKIYLQMSLDSTQARGVHEKLLLAQWNNDGVGNSIAIGQSARRAISHLKVLIIDGEYVVTGSTNWSPSGEEKQDNQLTFLRSAIVAAGYRAILDINHTEMLKQMAHQGK